MKNKIVTKDFTYESFPKNRKEQYFRIIKDNFLLLLKIGLTFLILLLPFIFAFFFKESYLRNIYLDASFSEEQKQAMSLSVEMIFNGIYVICIIIFCTGFSGVLKVFRRLIWNEPLFYKSDFFLGIKDNFVTSLIAGLLIGILYFLSYLFIRLTSGTSHIISYIIAIISFAIIVPILIQTIYIGSIYKSKFKISFSTSGRLFLRRGFFFILPLLIIYSMYFVSMIPIGTIYLCLIYIILFIVVLPLILLMSYILDVKIFDEYINTYYYPENAYLGLYVSPEKRKEIIEKSLKANNKNSI